MRYQFQLDGRPAAPVRDDWWSAAHDAVKAGYGTWLSETVHLDATQGAEIARVE